MLLGLLGLFWYRTVAAGERAERIARRICQEAGLQLLDDSVALVRTRPVLDRRFGPVVRRSYTFSYSEDGLGRAQGLLVLLGDRLESAMLAAEREATGTG